MDLPPPSLLPAGKLGDVVVRQIDAPDRWERWLAQRRPHTFLQSWAWGEFNRRQGHQVFRLGLWRSAPDGPLLALALVVFITARRGSFLFCPHGPVVAAADAPAVMPALTRHLQELGRQLHAGFIRLSTQLPDHPEFGRLLRRCGFRPAPTHMHPELAWLLDVRPDEDQLLAGMRKTMRNLIHRSQRLGITVRPAASPDDVRRFLSLYQRTADRHHYVAFPPRYLEDERAAFGPEQSVVLLAEHQGRLLAGAFLMFTGDSAFYHHGASQATTPPLPAAYLLQWEAIRLARRRGCTWYNFWGIAPPGMPRHPWAGLTQFKQGFGGFSERYLHAQDYPLRLSYWSTYLVERARRLKRGL